LFIGINRRCRTLLATILRSGCRLGILRIGCHPIGRKIDSEFDRFHIANVLFDLGGGLLFLFLFRRPTATTTATATTSPATGRPLL
jgi:hypothetical protein